jgi:hypothetical protein
MAACSGPLFNRLRRRPKAATSADAPRIAAPRSDLLRPTLHGWLLAAARPSTGCDVGRHSTNSCSQRHALQSAATSVDAPRTAARNATLFKQRTDRPSEPSLNTHLKPREFLRRKHSRDRVDRALPIYFASNFRTEFTV